MVAQGYAVRPSCASPRRELPLRGSRRPSDLRTITRWAGRVVLLVAFAVVAPSPWDTVARAQDAGLTTSRPVLTLLALAVLSLLPFVFMTATSFVKISIVFSVLRNALGAGQVPSGTVVTALAAVLTLYVMAPVGEEMWDTMAPIVARIDPTDPTRGESATAVMDAFEAGKAPLVRFLGRNASARERRLFFELAREGRPPERRAEVRENDLLVVLPAFLVTELTEAFQIGFLVFLPFLIVDMVVANVLLALGMHMLSPTTVSVPFKLLLLVLVDGFYLLARALVLGYQ
jgi:type III secretion protein R